MGHSSANSAVLQMLHNFLLCDDILEQDRPCTYNILLWRVQVMLYLLGYSNSLISFHSKTALLWGFKVTSHKKSYLGLHVKRRTFLHTCNQTWIFLTDFHKSPPISNLHGNISSGNHAHTSSLGRQTYGQTYRHDEGKRCFLHLSKQAQKGQVVFIVNQHAVQHNKNNICTPYLILPR